MSKSYTADIIIVGAGIAGLTLASLLAKHTAYRIVVVERSDLEPQVHTGIAPRVSAVNPLSVKVWEHIQIWQAESLQASPYKHMRVWDHCGGTLSFDADFQSDEVLGYVVQNHLLQAMLLAKIQTNSHVRLLTNQQCIELSQNSDGVRLELHDGSIQAQYLIGCDGAQSWVREQAGFAITKWEYEHTAIIAHVTTECEHHQTARQKFTTEGPLAFLPLLDAHQSSIVWSVPAERAKALMALSDEEFLKELEFTSEAVLGKITQTSARFAFPLEMRHAKQYVKERIIICADAAHTVHPMAGQGLNLAVQDVLALANVFIAIQLDANLTKQLRQYERARKAENWQMILVLEAIKRLYQIKTPLLQGFIQTGVKWIDKTNPLKNLFLKIASGDRSRLPAWMTEKS
ncbi:MAG: FAD-dependent monooxygenase [Pseudomonadota bacterium]